MTAAGTVTETQLIADGFLPPEVAEVRRLRRRLEVIALYAEEHRKPKGQTDPRVALDAIARAARHVLAAPLVAAAEDDEED